MSDVSPPEGGCKSDLVTIGRPRQRQERPPPCVRCRSPAWWNGWRTVFPVVAAVVTTVIERWELPLARAKCSRCKHGFTCYPPGFYPRRQYQLDVVAETCASVVLGGQTAEQAARAVHAGTASVRRWLSWVGELAAPEELIAVARHLDPDAPAGAGLPALPTATPSRRRAAQVLAALEHLGLALVRRGVALAERTGLGRVLGWQREAHGDVYGLVVGVRKLSPGMAAVGAPGGL